MLARRGGQPLPSPVPLPCPEVQGKTARLQAVLGGQLPSLWAPGPVGGVSPVGGAGRIF